MAKTTKERAERDLQLQKLLGEFASSVPRIKPGWFFFSPALAKNVMIKILKLYPEINLYAKPKNPVGGQGV